jgi:hypothetical protein
LSIDTTDTSASRSDDYQSGSLFDNRRPRDNATSAATTPTASVVADNAPTATTPADNYKLNTLQIATRHHNVTGLLPHHHPIVHTVNRHNRVGLLVHHGDRWLRWRTDRDPLPVLEVVEVAIPNHRRHASPVVSYQRSPFAPFTGATSPFQYTVAA